MTTDSYDLQATLARLFVYPVKSCAGVELPRVVLTDTGLELDRAWMVVDAQGEFVTQRELPRMALIRPQLREADMVLRAPGMLALHVAYDQVERPVRVRVWNDEVAAFDMGDLAAQWFSDCLSMPDRPRRLRLVRFDPAQRRLSSAKWTGDIEAPNQFSDGYPLLVVSEASVAELNARLAQAGHAAVEVERFRPNLVLAGIEAHDEDRVDAWTIAAAEGPVRLKPVKPCTRCTIPDVDPATAAQGHAVGDTLRGYRQDARVGGAVSFGMNCVVLEGRERVLAVGQPAGGDLLFE